MSYNSYGIRNWKHNLNQKGFFKGSEKLAKYYTPSNKKPNKQSRDRPKQLNFHVTQQMKHFNNLVMQNLSVIKSSPQIAEVFDNHKIVLTKAEVTPNFSDLYVLWTSSSNTPEETIQEALDAQNCLIKDEFNKLGTWSLGTIPRITFVQDYKTVEETRFQQALDSLSSIVPNEKPEPDLLPVLKNNVLNFDRDKVLTNILKSLDKAKAIHRIKEME